MIRFLRLVLLGLLAILLVTVAMANRTVVPVNLLPADMGQFLGFNASLQMPLFLAIFGGIVAGLLIGFVWEWFREYKHRSSASTSAREVARLEREVTRLRDKTAEAEDEVVALLDRRKAG
jgi:uncharacterized integral membrane protein